MGKLMAEQDRLRAQIGKVSSRTKEIQAQNSKMQGMVGDFTAT